MTKLAVGIIVVFGVLIVRPVLADPITIETYPDGGDIPETLGDWTLESHEINDPGTTTDSFTTDSGNTFHMDETVEVITRDWVEDGDGTIYSVPTNIITLTPENPIGAISFVISSEAYWAGAWVSAAWEDSSGNVGSLRNPDEGYFWVNHNTGELAGVGVGIWAEAGACITSVTIEPPEWGFGSIRTADCAVSVAEPGSLGLLGLGFFGIGFAARRRMLRA
ncbi:PEP-CTERM sorting domain-containing protein [Lentisalinibacter sediminis]|uniref:PEP-CTERM sorting domain-containing protein n=1 Tax=Lentisalinibacter sediminis TaxID=2992237 RepID=UPI00386FB9CC